MASNLTLVGGSPLIGNPIIYQVTAATLKGEVSFHKVKLEVTAGLLPAADDYEINSENQVVLTFSSPANSGETLQIDISSALRAAADSYRYSPIPPSIYPRIVFSLKAWDEYMQNGMEAQKTGIISNEGGTAIMGAFSDLERMLSGGNKSAQLFSRKPIADLENGVSYEVIEEGETIIVPQDWEEGKVIGNITSGPSSKVYVASIEDSDILNTVFTIKKYGGRSFLVFKKGYAWANKNPYHFRFVNSLGVLESITVNCLATQQMQLTSDKHIISMPETFSRFSRGIYEKSNDYEKWKFSTGPLDKAWVSWYLHEFLTAKYAWILISDNWIPCHIVAEETVVGRDETKSDAISIDFSVELDINGSPFV